MPMLLMCEVCHAKSEETYGLDPDWPTMKRAGWVAYGGHVWCPEHRHLSKGATKRLRRKAAEALRAAKGEGDETAR